MMKTSKNTAFRLLMAPLLAFGLVEASSASNCSLTDDVWIDDGSGGKLSAAFCGMGPDGDNVANTPVADPQLPDDYLGWDVNLPLHNVEGGPDWQYYYKQDLGSDLFPDTLFPEYSFGADGINLQITADNGVDARSTGEFSFNAVDPFLIVLGDGGGTEYHWYYFTGITGAVTGEWDTSGIFPGPNGGGKDLSNITVYENDESFPPVPVPAAVWLFGSGLIGLVGIARRRRKA